MPASVAVEASGARTLRITWSAAAGADRYRIERRVGTGAAWVTDGTDAAAGATAALREVSVHFMDWSSTRYRVSACNAGGCTPSADTGVAGVMLATIGHLKAPSPVVNGAFGIQLAVSSDGGTLAVGQPGDNGRATGVGGDPTLPGASTSGAVQLYLRSGTGWGPPIHVKASNTGANDQFGRRLALSADGRTLAVAAPHESSAAAGIDGNQADESASAAGAVYVFARGNDGLWRQQAYVKASNPGAGDRFGSSVALSADGTTLAVGAIGEASATGHPADDGATNSGAVWVFARVGGTWSQQAYLKAANIGADDRFGTSLALAGHGDTLAVGAPGEDGGGRGPGANASDESATDAGAVYVFTRTAGTWAQHAYLKASNAEANDQFGQALALSADGTLLAVTAPGEGSAAVAVDGNQADNAAPGSGAAYVFTRTGSGWMQQAYVKAPNNESFDQVGVAVALSGDGRTLALGALFEDGAARGVGGDSGSNALTNSGAVHVFRRDGTGPWAVRAYVKAPNPQGFDRFGGSLALSADGGVLVVGADGEDSGATGLGTATGARDDETASGSGAVYLY